MKAALREIIDELMLKPSAGAKDINQLKFQVAKKYALERMPSNSELIGALKPMEKRRLLPLLRRKATRTISGVTVVAVMTKPYPCPQEEPCAYCPGGPRYGVPQSYTGHEPAAMRGEQNHFDPYLQVRSRIDQLHAIGHNVDKVELIVMGGTFPATPVDYQKWFVQRCLDAIAGETSQDLEEAKRQAEDSAVRNVGITVETRPDWAKENHVDLMLGMGVTRVELGVQNPDDGIYRLVGRKHSVQDVTEATRVMKDAGLKIVYHMMPGMPGSNFDKDLASFKEVFTNPAFKPDMIKIYPCLVLDGTKVCEWYKSGACVPYSTVEAADFIVKVKQIVPPWVRIMRVQRDIPLPLIVAGVDKSNLRQLVQRRLSEQGIKCNCIRCREVGHRNVKSTAEVDLGNTQILLTRYDASEGKEVFISVEDTENDALIGYLRLRIPSRGAHRPEIRAEPCAIIRELRVYGSLVPVGEHLPDAWQHKGYGTILLAQAERLAREDYGLGKILVISALGTKRYYKKFGYRYDGVYMSKRLVDRV